VRGSPSDVLNVLMHGSLNTPILGPARTYSHFHTRIYTYSHTRTYTQVVRGSPSDVLDVLMHGSVNTTILGPARTVEVLQCIKDDKTTKEVRMCVCVL